MDNHLNLELDIAVIGMAGRFPGAPNIQAFWNLLKNGKEGLTHFSKDELLTAGVDKVLLNDPNYVKTRGITADADKFDAFFFDFSPNEAEIMDPQQRVFLETCWEALENSGYNADLYKGLIGLFAGVSMNTYLFTLLNARKGQLGSAEGYQLAIGNDKDFLTTRASYKMNLRGPSVDVQTACSTSLVAIHMACQNLLNFSCDMALAGGVSITFPQEQGYFYQEGMILSPDGHCRAFDAKAGGTVSGSGAGIVVLKRLEDALNDGDTIYALVKGSAFNNDGAVRVGYTAPSVDGQADVIATAQANAGIYPEDISYIEAHGTGTELGDPIEIAALSQAFGSASDKKQYCAVGSVKSNIGHLDAAAGVAGFIKTVLALQHRQIPASLHFEQANPKIDFANSPFYVNDKLKNWETSSIRRAGISSFGIGGTNAHIILQEAPQDDKAQHNNKSELLLISAKTQKSLDANTDALLNHLERNPEIDFSNVSYTLFAGRKHFNQRRFIVADDHQDAIKILKDKNPKKIFETIHKKDPSNPPLAFMFSGQGAQYSEMAKGLYTYNIFFKKELDHYNELLKNVLHEDILDIIFKSENQDRLNQTQFTQPALFIIELALAKLFMHWGVKPESMVGHSIGEYVAAHLAGVFSLEDALKIVAERGRLMQSMPAGEMLSVNLDEHELETYLSDHISLAAINSKGSSVLSGTTKAISEIEMQFSDKGIESRRLHTSHAFHSNMMDPILSEFTALINNVQLNTPQVPYLSNVSGTWITIEQATDPEYYSKHLRNTVRFRENISCIFENEHTLLLEVGPGKSLTSLAKRHPAMGLGRIILSSIRHPQDEINDLAFIQQTIGRLWLAGVQFDIEKIFEDQKLMRIPLPTYAFDRKRYWYGDGRNQMSYQVDSEDLNKKSDINKWFYTPVWKQSYIPSGSKNTEDTWLIFINNANVWHSQILKTFNAKCKHVVEVQVAESFSKVNDFCYTVSPGNVDDYKALLDALVEKNIKPTQILHLWSLNNNLGKDIIKSQQNGFFSLTAFASAFSTSSHDQKIQLFVITQNLHSITGSERIIPDHSLIMGPCKVINQEVPQLKIKTIDFDDLPEKHDFYSNFLINETYMPETHFEIAYRNGSRWIKEYEDINQLGTESKIKTGGTYIITGGLGRISLALAEYLAATHKANLILVDRQQLPEKTEWEHTKSQSQDEQLLTLIKKLQEIDKKAGALYVFTADISSEDDMQKIIDFTYSEFTHCTGIIHAAGIIGDSAVSMINQVSEKHLVNQLTPKLQGTKVLAKVLEKHSPPDIIILQSSLSTILGGIGFSAYAAANHFLDTFSLMTKNTKWISVNWDGWNFTENGKSSTSKNITDFSINPDEGIKVFARLLSGSYPAQVIISTGDLKARMDKWLFKKDEHTDIQEPSEAKYDRPNLPTAYIAPETDLEKDICKTWQALLGINKIGINDDFFDLGGNSLLGTQLIATLRKKFQVELPIRSLFEDPTISGIGKIIEKQKEQAPKQDLISDMLNKVENMSDAQVAEMLKKNKND